MIVQFIVCAHNNENIIKDCLDSILNLKKKRGWKIKVMVVDDNSIDSTYKIIQSYKKVDSIKFFSTRGPAFCRNAGYEKIKGADFYFFMDSDVILNKNCLIELMGEMRWYHVGICGPKLLLSNGRINSAGGALSKSGYGYDIGYKKPGNMFNQRKQVMYICSAAMLVKASTIKKIGLFDKTYFYGHEDTDLGWRANLSGIRVIYVPKAKATHKKSQTVKHNKSMIYFHGTKNKIRSIIKNYDLKNMIIYGSLYKILLFGDLLFRPYRKEKLKACLWLLKYLPDHLRERRKIQKLRKFKDRTLPFSGVFPR